MMQLDRLDVAIPEALQQDASLSAADCARVGLSATPRWKRVKRLEDAGCDRTPRGLGQPGAGGFAGDGVCQHPHHPARRKWLRQFTATVSAMPEVTEFHRMSGDVDYLLRWSPPTLPGTTALQAPYPQCRPRWRVVGVFHGKHQVHHGAALGGIKTAYPVAQATLSCTISKSY